MRRVRGCVFGAALVVMLAVPGRAAASVITPPLLGDPGAFSFSGNFEHDNDVALFFFSLSTDAFFQASTTSPAIGGFDTLLSLLLVDSTGQLARFSPLYENDDPDPGAADRLIDPLTLSPQLLLTAGSYALAVTQSGNRFEPQFGGFTFDDTPMFTCAPDDPTCKGFVDFLGESRTSDFAGSISIEPLVPEPEPDPVPEPGTLALVATGVTGLVARHWRRRA
jgi:hypothetical protein